MLDLLRRHSRSTLIYVLFGIIIAVFVFTFNTSGPGGGGGCGGGAETVTMAEVNGEDIEVATFDMAMMLSQDAPRPGRADAKAMQQEFFYKNTRFASVPPDLRYANFLRDEASISPLKAEKVMQDLIETWLVSQKAEELGFRVTDKELSKRIVREEWKDPETGKVDPKFFEDFVRREILREKMIAALTSHVQEDPRVIDWYVQQMGDKVNLEYVELSPKALAPLVEVTDAQVAEYLAKHADEVGHWYEEHVAEFKKPERVVLRGIYKKAPLKALIDRAEDETKKAEMMAQRGEARAKADAVLAQLQAAPTPAPGPAQQPAPQPDTGAEPEAAPAPAEAAPAEAAPTEAAPAEAAPGEAAPAEAAPAEAAPAEAAPAEAAPTEAAPAEAAPAVAAPAVVADAFAALAEKESEHPSKDKGGLLDGEKTKAELATWPFGPALAEAAFTLPKGKVSDVIETDSGFWIVKVEDKLATEEKSLEQAKTEIARRMLQEELAKKKVDEVGSDLLAKAKASADKPLAEIVEGWSSAQGEAGKGLLTASETGPFSQMAPGPIPRTFDTFGNIPGIGKAPALVRAAFELSAEQRVPDQLFEVEGGDRKLLVRFVDKAQQTDDEKSTLRGQVESQLSQFRAVQTYLAWYRGILDKAMKEEEVKLESGFLEILGQERQAYEDAMKKLVPPVAQGG